MDTMTQLAANLEKATQELAALEVIALKAPFPFQRNEALAMMPKLRNRIARLNHIMSRASQFEEEDIVAFLDCRPAEF